MTSSPIRNGWDAAPDEAVCRAMDESGSWFWFFDEPFQGDCYWTGDLFEEIPLHLYPDFTGDWENSLQWRPEKPEITKPTLYPMGDAPLGVEILVFNQYQHKLTTLTSEEDKTRWQHCDGFILYPDVG